MTNNVQYFVDDILAQKYLSYAVSTIISRSLPDVRDGLKPVHRRIIYSMHQLKLHSGSPFKKSARIVGDVMGKFHPHGDQAIYDSLVRLAQDFSTRAPLIEGQGNFGNIDGDNAAAMRYTEARLSLISNYFFEGIEEDAVDFIENYDGQNLEPVVLPSKLPNILLNGAIGIAVGMATNIPPHNLLELNNALIKLIKKPSITLSNILKDFQGPDFPTGGEILMTSSEKKEIYKNGRGSFTVRSRWEKEDLKNGMYQIVITEIPYQINKARLIEQLANLINNKKIPLDDVLDESDEKIRIILKPRNRNIEAEKLIELCFKLSDLSTKYSCNFNVLENGILPKQLGLKDILNNFITYRKTTIKRKSLFNKEKISKRLIILDGYLIPGIILFGLGAIPAIIGIFIYACPPLIRLTDLGIRLVDKEVIEAAESFGASKKQKLWGVQLPLALPNIMQGINQCTMMALAMVVIASMIGTRGLGDEVLLGLQQLNVGSALEAGLAIVLLAIVFDRITQAYGEKIQERTQPTKKKKNI